MTSRGKALRLAVVTGMLVAVAGLAFCPLSRGANVTFGVDLTLSIIQARKAGASVTVDPKIPAGVKSELFRAFGSKYKEYTLLKSDERMAHMSQNQDYDLPNGKKLTVRVTGYKQLWIMFLVMYDGKPDAFKMSHGTYHALNCGPEPDPLIIVISAKKVEVSD
jgi:hypothetical protein